MGVEVASAEQAGPAADVGAPRRIRDDVRDGACVMAFTGVASTVTALSLVALARLVG